MLYNQNLLKSGWVVINSEEKRVIDSNKLVEEKLATAGGMSGTSQETKIYQPVSFDEEIREESGEESIVSKLFEEDAEPDEFTQMQPELVEGAAAESKEVLEARQQAEEILAGAKAQAQEILQQAQVQAQAEAKQAYEQAYEQGEQDGYQQGKQAAQAQTEALEQEFQKKEMELNRQYEQRLEEMEPYMIREMTGIYEHVFNVDLSQYRSVLQHLVANTLRSIAVSDDYLIHVSQQDYSFVTMQKPKIVEEGCVGNANIEIVEDRTLSKNECLIETSDGIFDCSLAVQLEELKRKLQLLSYTGKKE